MELERIQAALREQKLDGWLFYDHHVRDPLAYRILGLDDTKLYSRRWYYFIPVKGAPGKLVHAIEPAKLDSLPGDKHVYLPWTEQQTFLRHLLGGAKRVAMQYSPNNAIPYVSLVDGGTIDLIRSFSVEVVSSADLVQMFEAALTADDFETHLEAGRRMHAILDRTFAEVRRRVLGGAEPTEYEIQQFMVGLYDENGLTCQNLFPIVGVNAHAADPHYEPTPDQALPIRKGDLLLLDLWARLDQPRSVYFDITWTGYLGDPIPPKYIHVFDIVRAARDRAVEYARERFAAGRTVYGWEVDDACRTVIDKAGYGRYFIHRTGHSIGETVHGNGVNIDNLETKDERRLVPGILFSVEPGIYLPGEFGIRSEIDVFINHNSEVVVTGPQQSELVKILNG
jgi:Xaa-Pro aminopeptidase